MKLGGPRAAVVLVSIALIMVIGGVLRRPPVPPGKAGGFQLTGQAHAALLRGDWGPVLAALGGTSAAARGPARPLLGLAALALNRNDEAACVLLGLVEDDLTEWDDWTRGLVATQARAPVAHFLRGDALARRGEWQAASQALGRALALDRDHALALDAAGVVHAMLGEGDLALAHLRRAVGARPDLADAHASRGVYWLQRGNGAAGALAAFDRALEISPKFALAHVGRMSVLVALSRWDEAQQSIEAASRGPACLVHLVADASAQTVAFMDGGRGGGGGRAVDPPGTTLQRRLDDLFQRPSQGTMSAFVNYLGNHPEERAQGIEMFGHRLKSAPGSASTMAGLTDRGALWNAERGPAEALTRVMEGFKISGSKEVGGVRVGAGLELGPLGRLQSSVTRDNFQTFSELRGVVRRESAGEIPGGVTTSLVGTPLDAGEWPAVVWYGLLYPVSESVVMTPHARGEVAR